ncbi:MAG: hypothetical protein AB7F79_06325 [Steroidobacteraceae bacterium]
MKATMRVKTLWLRSILATFVLAGLLTACDRGGDNSVEAVAPAQQQSSITPVVIDPFASMAKALYLTKAEPPVDLRFEWAAVPQAAQPMQLKLNLLGLLDLSVLQLQVSTPGGLVISHGEQASYDALKQGESWAPTLELTAKSNGLYLLNLELQATTESVVRSFKYSIPVAVTTPEFSDASASSLVTGKSG